jgi:hypothetical protein
VSLSEKVLRFFFPLPCTVCHQRRLDILESLDPENDVTLNFFSTVSCVTVARVSPACRREFSTSRFLSQQNEKM